MYLVDLETGAVLSIISRENPQTKYGNNVISRIEFARKGQEILEREIRTAVKVYGLPLIGSFVGADALALVLATEMYKSEKISMAIDIGTNTEIALGNKDKLIATSCAAGPAFEGYSVTYGIGGVSGAIKEVRIEEDGNVRYKTVGDAAPIGICGSGLVDTQAELLDEKEDTL